MHFAHTVSVNVNPLFLFKTDHCFRTVLSDRLIYLYSTLSQEIGQARFGMLSIKIITICKILILSFNILLILYKYIYNILEPL